MKTTTYLHGHPQRASFSLEARFGRPIRLRGAKEHRVPKSLTRGLCRPQIRRIYVARTVSPAMLAIIGAGLGVLRLVRVPSRERYPSPIPR